MSYLKEHADVSDASAQRFFQSSDLLRASSEGKNSGSFSSLERNPFRTSCNSFGKVGIRVQRTKPNKETNTFVHSVASEDDTCSASTACSKLTSSNKTLCSLNKHELNWGSKQNVLYNTDTKMVSRRILTPPPSFKDCPVQTSTTQNYHDVQTSLHALTTALLNEPVYSTSSRPSSKNTVRTLRRQNSYSLDVFPAQSITNCAYSKETSASKKLENLPAIDRKSISESDISEFEIPPLPLCFTPQTATASIQIQTDNLSNCSTSV